MIPFSPPRIDQETVHEVTDALLSGWITTGPKTMQLENELTAYCGSKATVCLNSATAGMQLALDWLGIKEGDEVIIPSYTYCATANVVYHAGATPIMVDVNEHDFNISITKIKEAITPKTKAIIPVDIAGYPCDYAELWDLIEEKKSIYQSNNEIQERLGRIAVVVDAAHSIGADYKGRKTGVWGDMTVFSFHAVKNLTTAEGGAISIHLPSSFDSEEIRKQLKTRSLHGQSKDAFSKMKAGAWQYDVEKPGFKCNMTDIHAAIGLVELRRYESNLQRRKTIFERYASNLKKHDWVILPEFESNSKKSSYHLFLMRIKGINEEERNAMIQFISERQIAVNVHYLPLPMLTAYKNLGYKIEDYPQAYKNYQNEISVPVYFDLKDEQVDEVCDALIDAYNHVRS